ncbi:MAG: polyprenyl synthetase family protein [Candidatus Bathyarchaeota archaeon]|nr:polyprenyl synthetase family protein [Candidatus Bathyarchaeota archaeon]
MAPQTGKKVVADLKKRSKKGLRFAKKVMKKEKMYHAKLRHALNHYLYYWNDFTHAGLFSVACDAVGGSCEKVVATQASIAMMAAAFDIHDDIIDQSIDKQKKPTVYGKYGLEMALLLGNAFLIKGFKLFVDTTKDLSEKNKEIAMDKIKDLLFQVGNAHALEVGMKENKKFTPKNYLKITELKAASVEADMYLGALFGGGKEKDTEALSEIGRILGVLATLRDDLIDVFDIQELNTRLSVNDLPLPLIFAMDNRDVKDRANKIIAKPRLSDQDVAELVDLTLVSKPVVELKEKMKKLIDKGLILAEKLPNSITKGKIQLLLLFMLEDL